MTTTDTTPEVVQQTLAEYERIAISTGEWNGSDAPEFSNDGVDFTPAWLPTPDHEHPLVARASVYRKGVDRPTTAYVRWDEALPADEEWRARWLRDPIALFGSFTKRSALRSAFRDVIGDRREPDELPAPVHTDSPDRDWLADLAEASTVDAVHALHADAKAARVVTVTLEREIRKRLLAVQGRGIGALLVTEDVPKLAEGGMVKPGGLVVAKADGIEQVIPLVTPADLARVLASRSAAAATKGGRRPQKPKPRG